MARACGVSPLRIWPAVVTFLLLLIAGVFSTSQVAAVPSDSDISVTHGQKVISPSKKYPWVIPIVWGPKGSGRQECTASLIDQQTALTAAHCIAGKNRGVAYVRIGGNRVTWGRRIDVDGWWKHPQFRMMTYENDVAVLHLRTPANVPTLASLPTSPDVPRKGLHVLGWGKDQRGKVTGRLLHTWLNQAKRAAAKYYGAGYHPESQIAAGRPLPHRRGFAGSCSSEDGGPLTDSANVLLGIASYGAEEQCSDAPGLFTKVSIHQQAIQEGKAAAEAMGARSRPTPTPTPSPSLSADPGNPTVSWNSPGAGATVSGPITLIADAAASGTALVTKACVTIDGAVPSQNYAHPSVGSLRLATYDPATGCWTRDSTMTSLMLYLDSTPWTNGNYTFAWTVTDSNNRVSTTASRTFTVNN